MARRPRYRKKIRSVPCAPRAIKSVVQQLEEDLENKYLGQRQLEEIGRRQPERLRTLHDHFVALSDRREEQLQDLDLDVIAVEYAMANA
jgi:hypothetical protein